MVALLPGIEHARLLLEEGAIGDVNSLHSDFPDPCYDFQYAPMVFGADNKPTAVVATGGGQGAARAAIAQYGPRRRRFPLSTFTVEFPEITERVSCPSLRVSSGRGRLTRTAGADLRLEGAHHARAARHCPTGITIRKHENEGPHRYRNRGRPPPSKPSSTRWLTIETMPNQGGFSTWDGGARCMAAGLKESRAAKAERWRRWS